MVVGQVAGVEALAALGAVDFLMWVVTGISITCGKVIIRSGSFVKKTSLCYLDLNLIFIVIHTVLFKI